MIDAKLNISANSDTNIKLECKYRWMSMNEWILLSVEYMKYICRDYATMNMNKYNMESKRIDKWNDILLESEIIW